jgi:hypothetical protein
VIKDPLPIRSQVYLVHDLGKSSLVVSATVVGHEVLPNGERRLLLREDALEKLVYTKDNEVFATYAAAFDAALLLNSGHNNGIQN